MADDKLIRDALGSDVPQYFNLDLQMFAVKTTDGSVITANDVNFGQIKLLRDRLGSPIPQLWDAVNAKWVVDDGSYNSGGVSSWNDLTDKPLEFKPESHKHQVTDVEGLETAIADEVAKVVDSAPDTLDTLKELSKALGDDPNFATTVTTEIGKRAKQTDLDTTNTNVTNLTGTVSTLSQTVTQTFNEVTAQLAQTATKVKLQPTVMSNRRLAFIEPELPYTSWPYGCLFFDKATNKVCQAYTAGDSHVGANKKVYFRMMADPFESFGNRVLIADRTSEGLGGTVHACGIASDGTYYAIVRFTDSSDTIQSTYLYKSTDRGGTWTGEQWKENGTNPLNPGEAGDLFCTKDGTLLTYYRSINGNQFITRKPASSNHWTNIAVSNPLPNPTIYVPLEGEFVQVSDRTIICVVRRAMMAAPYTEKIGAAYTISTDDGLTWAPLAVTDIEDMTAAPAAMIHHEDEKVVEIFWSSRYKQSDGYGSLYQSITTEENAKQGIFGKPKRIGIGMSSRDFGYVAAAKTHTNKIILTFYNGTSERTGIQMMTGVRDNVNIANSDTVATIINPNNGKKVIDFEVTGSEKNILRDVGRIEHPNLDTSVINYKMGLPYYLRQPVNLITTLPANSSWQTVDVAALLSESTLNKKIPFNELSGYIIEVIYETGTTAECSIEFGLEDISFFPARILSAGVSGLKQNRSVIMPAQTTVGGVPSAIGSFQYRLSFYTSFSSITIKLCGYLAKN